MKLESQFFSSHVSSGYSSGTLLKCTPNFTLNLHRSGLTDFKSVKATILIVPFSFSLFFTIVTIAVQFNFTTTKFNNYKNLLWEYKFDLRFNIEYGEKTEKIHQHAQITDLTSKGTKLQTVHRR